MRIVTVGANHATAPLELLEQLSIAPGELDTVLPRLKGIVEEGFVLSTCNRTEVYALVGHERDVQLLFDVFAERDGADIDDLRKVCYVHVDGHAVRHALRVASGLDSMVLGEDHIQAQLKRALAAARGAETLGPILERLGSAALSCGKRVRTFTGIGHHSVSLESLGVDAALQRVASSEPFEAVVLGSGSSAAIVVKQLRRARVPAVTVVGRTHGTTAALASDWDAVAASWERLPDTLVDARVVFSCTSAPHPVLGPETLARRVAVRGDASLLCVDLGMPRDVDPAVAAMPGVSVIGLDELGSIAAAHRAERERHLPAAEAIVERETARFGDWVRARTAGGTIGARRARAEAMADAEVKRALARLQTASAHDRAVVADLARRLTRKLMHDITEDLKLEASSRAGIEAYAITEPEEAAS